MGREIRRVPPNWEHPRYTEDDAPRSDRVGDYRSCFDCDYETASREWVEEFDKFRESGDGYPKYCEPGDQYWDWEPPPRKASYRPKFAAEPTWFQVYETVSEGTPVSPPFETPEELARYLSTHGDFWYQKTPIPGFREKPSYESALAFVNSGHSFSMVVHNTPAGAEIQGPYQQHEASD